MSAQDRQQFSELYQKYGRLVRNFLFRLGARSPLDDLTQETFLKAWKNREQLNEPKAAKAWLLRIALHQFYDWGRRQKGHFVELKEDTLIDESASASKFEMRMDAIGALDALPLPQKTVCLLFYIEELSIAEIATLLQVPEGTVKTRLMKAREKMQVALTLPETHAQMTETES